MAMEVALSPLTDFEVAVASLDDVEVAVASLDDVEVAVASLDDVEVAVASLDDVEVTLPPLDGVGVAVVPLEDVEVPLSPVAKKMRRLRKVKDMEITDSGAAVDDGVVAETVSRDAEVRMSQRESSEEILKRFGRGCGDGDGSRKRKAVQSTIFATVVDMSKEARVGVHELGGEADRLLWEDAAEENTSSKVGVKQVEEPRALEDGASADDRVYGAGTTSTTSVCDEEDVAPVSKKKRSNTVKRCSAHAMGMTFKSATSEDEAEGMDEMVTDTGIDDAMKESDEEHSDGENGNDGGEGGNEAQDSEKGNEENDVGGAGGGSSAGWSDGWAEEEMSMESILEKARRMVSEMSNPRAAASAKPTKENKRKTEDDLTGIDDQSGKKNKSKKEEERIKREEIYAESQRLLRESKGVAFLAPAPVMKPVSSVLEKIRQRRLQLGCSTGTASSQEMKSVSRLVTKKTSCQHVDLTVDGDTEVEIEVFSSIVVKSKEVKTKEAVVDAEAHTIPAQEVSRDMEDVDVAGGDGKVQDDTVCDKKSPNTPEVQIDLLRDDSTPSRSREKNSGLERILCNMDTQDLLCMSQLSAATEEILDPTAFESVGTTATDFMALDTQLLDEDLTPGLVHVDHHLEKKEISVRPSCQSEVYTEATHVRGLIDDEAEDEDEDILAENAEEEESLGDEEDLLDLIGTTEKEKADDKARRDALHRKWLDQQDTEQTEDILERLRTGRSTRWRGRDRVGSCLDEDDDLVNTRDSVSLDKNNLGSQVGADKSSAEEDQIEEPSISLRERMRSRELEMDCLLDEYEDPEDMEREEPVVEDEILEDDEEHEQSIIRQRMLEESEDQLVFLSPADDETSREVLSLITKVNVGNLKTKSSTGHSEIRAAICSSLPSKPSFLGRSSSSSSLPPPTHKHGASSGSARSFVFGRDDSNSAHGFPSLQAQEEKKTHVSKSVHDKGVSSKSTVGGKKRQAPQPSRGPSLFEMLKKQSKELEQDLKKSSSAIAKKWGSDTEAFSMFASKKSVTPSRRKL